MIQALCTLAILLLPTLSYSMRQAPRMSPVPMRSFSYKATSISYSVKNPKLIASLEAARNNPARPTPQNPQSSAYCPRTNWRESSTPSDADIQIERQERTRLHNQVYSKNMVRPHRTHALPITEIAGELAGAYVSYKICQKLDETLFSHHSSPSHDSHDAHDEDDE